MVSYEILVTAKVRKTFDFTLGDDLDRDLIFGLGSFPIMETIQRNGVNENTIRVQTRPR